jgi:hypothetical protein
MGAREAARASDPVWRRLLERAGAARIPSGNAEELAALGRGTPALTAFESTFGGHQVAQGWTFGVLACAALPRSKRGLVPVAESEDVVAYLDERGAGWIQDTVEDPEPRRVAASAEALVTGLLLWHRHHHAAARRELAGKHGERVAAQLSLPPIEAASSRTERWWGDDAAWVVERGRVTLLGAVDAARLPAPGDPPPAKALGTRKPRGRPASVTSPQDLALDLAEGDVTRAAFVLRSPGALLAHVTSAAAEALGAEVVASGPDGATLTPAEGVELRVRIATMGKGCALWARLRGHRAEDSAAWSARLGEILR